MHGQMHAVVATEICGHAHVIAPCRVPSDLGNATHPCCLCSMLMEQVITRAAKDTDSSVPLALAQRAFVTGILLGVPCLAGHSAAEVMCPLGHVSMSSLTADVLHTVLTRFLGAFCLVVLCNKTFRIQTHSPTNHQPLSVPSPFIHFSWYGRAQKLLFHFPRILNRISAFRVV